MDLVVERFGGERFTYPNADRSKVIIEFVENHLRDTVTYYPEDFRTIEVFGADRRPLLLDVIEVLDHIVAVSRSYEDQHLREYYERNMAAIRSMLVGLMGGAGNGD
jgi:hypothetical protein